MGTRSRVWPLRVMVVGFSGSVMFGQWVHQYVRCWSGWLAKENYKSAKSTCQKTHTQEDGGSHPLVTILTQSTKYAVSSIVVLLSLAKALHTLGILLFSSGFSSRNVPVCRKKFWYDAYVLLWYLASKILHSLLLLCLNFVYAWQIACGRVCINHSIRVTAFTLQTWLFFL